MGVQATRPGLYSNQDTRLMTRSILITPGEPAGIGPDITIQIAQLAWPVPLVAIADPDLLMQRAALLGLPLTLTEGMPPRDRTHQPGHVYVLPVRLNGTVTPSVLNPDNAHYVIDTLKLAATHCLKQHALALVTGPVHKGVINQAGVPFSGHTEFFASQANVTQTVMLFVTDQMKVALATTHLPLSAVPAAVTADRLKRVLTVLQDGLRTQFHLSSPRILLCGLNPHAGENGYLGREEIDIISPLIQTLQKQGMDIRGPLPADTVFTPRWLSQTDAILAIYHDQALPVVKYASFGHAVNMTLGLPFIRTSVDHGTALDVAGTGKSDAGSLEAAIRLAIVLAPPSLAG